MTPRTRKRAPFMTRALLILMVGTSLGSCASIRHVTYPPDFHYLDSQEVKSVMHEMACHLLQLQQLVVPDAGIMPDTPRRVPQDAVLAELDALERTAASLTGSSGTDVNGKPTRPATNHLLIDNHIDEFMAQIQRARWLVDNDPPDYYGVGQLAGNCLACHQLR